MRTVERDNLYKGLAAITAAGFLLFTFQNCGQAGFEDAIETSTGTLSANSTSAPFAYESNFDQVSYSSCFGSTLAGNTNFYTFRAGAYETGGVNATTTFLNYVTSKIKPVYPATVISTAQIKSFVETTPENSAATLQLALRTRGSPQQIRSATSTTPTAGTDYSNLLMSLTDDRMMETVFSANGAVARYFPLASTTSARVLEGSITYNSDEGVAYSLRNDMTNNGMLSLTYTLLNGSAYAARFPTSRVIGDNLVYGHGYKATFAAEIAPLSILVSGNSAVQPNYKNPVNIMTALQEYDLLNPSVVTKTWTCPQARRYAIVRYQDRATYCPMDSYDRLADASYRKELEIVRRHLRADNWDVSIDRRCVVPKAGSCYINASGVEETVEYNQANECYQGITGLANAAITKRCAQYVSFCTRE